MYSLLFTTIVAVLARLVITQTIDPDSVPLSTRQAWCNSQISECPLICVQEEGNSAATDSNTCDPASLTYSCVCSNGLAPNASEYSQTLPYYICTQYNTNCQTACGSDNNCAAACVQDHPCGATNPTRVNTSTMTTMSATSTTAGAAASTGADGSGSAATTASSGGSGTSAATRIFLNIGQIYGLGLLAGSIFAGFAFMA